MARGRVVDDETGEPIPGVMIAALEELPTGRANPDGAERMGRRSVASDSMGTFAIALPVGAASIEARLAHEHYLPLKVQLDSDPMASRDFRLRRRGSLRGVVLDRSGVAIPGAPLLFRLPEDDYAVSARGDSIRMLADAEGRFELTNLLGGRVFVFVLRQPRDADENALTSSRFRIDAGKSRDVVVRIDRPERCHVTGEISGKSGPLAKHVPVFLPYADEGGWTMAKAGKYGFDAGGVEHGRYLVAILPEDDGDTDVPMALLPDVEVSGFGAQRFSFTLPTSYLEGTVAPSSSARLPRDGPAGLRVLAVPSGLSGFAADFLDSPKAAQSFGAPVDPATGSFRIEHLSRGSHRLELWDVAGNASEPLAVNEVQVDGSRTLTGWTYQAK